jgi:hypothetical protein
VSTPPTAAAATPTPAPPLQAGRQVEHTGARLQPGRVKIFAEDFKGKFYYFSDQELDQGDLRLGANTLIKSFICRAVFVLV